MSLTLTDAQVEDLRAVVNAGPFTFNAEAATRLTALLPDPKPTEPLGLGAVVEDEIDVRWCRNHEGVWVSSKGHWRLYEEVDAVRVLSEGVR